MAGGPRQNGAMPSTPLLYLASQSPRRRQLLQQIGIEHAPLLADDADVESLEAMWPGELPAAYLQRVTRAELQAAVARRILGKPADAGEARAMLRAPSGSTHRVLTTVAVHDDRRARAALNVSHVRFASMPEAAIDAYVAADPKRWISVTAPPWPSSARSPASSSRWRVITRCTTCSTGVTSSGCAASSTRNGIDSDSTHRRTGTCGMTWSTMWAAVRDMRRAPHDGQNPRRLQLKASSLSWPHSPERSLRKP